jgi:TM2 domain-containing membrane protein YozV
MSATAPMSTFSESEISNKKLAAGLTGIFLGAFGVHKFILGYTKPAVIMLVVSLAGGLVTCGVASFVMGVIGLIEGIIYLTKTNDEFEATYLDAEKSWF